MRSRFSAFARGDAGYLLRSWHPSTRPTSLDLDDGLRAGLFQMDDLAHLPVVGDALRQARFASLDVPPPRLRHERATWVRENQMFEVRRSRGVVAAPAKESRPLQLCLWRFRRVAVLFDDLRPQRHRACLVL